MNEIKHSAAWETLKVKHPTVQVISLDSIYIDQRFQRPLVETHKNNILNNLHSQGVGVILVASVIGGDPLRSGRKYACVNAQTRLVALNQLQQEVQSGVREYDGTPPTTVLAEIYENLTVEECAELFNLRNNQTAVSRLEKARIAFVGGDPDLEEIVRQVERAGYTMFPHDGSVATITCIPACRQIHQLGIKYKRPGLLYQALTIQAGGFGVQRGDVNPFVLKATANILRKNTDIDVTNFVTMLRNTTVGRILAQAQVISAEKNKNMPAAVEFYLVNEYNKKRGNILLSLRSR
jgi:hypothetical protein